MSRLPQRSATAWASLAIFSLIVEVHRRDGRVAAGGVNALLDLLERVRGARGQDDVRAGGGERSAVAAPMPRLAPVTSASLPSNGFVSVM